MKKNFSWVYVVNCCFMYKYCCVRRKVCWLVILCFYMFLIIIILLICLDIYIVDLVVWMFVICGVYSES